MPVINLVFNEDDSASAGDRLTRHDLSGEAIRPERRFLQRRLAEVPGALARA